MYFLAFAVPLRSLREKENVDNINNKAYSTLAISS